jgi:pyrrolidone-carboxylate peptidase
MYRALHYCATELPDCRCGFVHLPFMPSQVCDLISRGESVIDPHHQNAIASMPLTMQREAIRLVIQCIALELERERQ